MAKLIDRIKQSLAKEGYSTGTNNARNWLRAKVKDLNPSTRTLMGDRDRLKNNSTIGKMYFYFYRYDREIHLRVHQMIYLRQQKKRMMIFL